MARSRSYWLFLRIATFPDTEKTTAKINKQKTEKLLLVITKYESKGELILVSRVLVTF